MLYNIKIKYSKKKEMYVIKKSRVVFRLKMVAFKRYGCPKKCP